MIIDDDEVMDRCFGRAWDLFGAEHAISHERYARDLTEFLDARIGESPDSAERTALLSVVRSAGRAATYLSTGRKAIVQALAVLIRLAIPYDQHPDYREEWRS